MKKTDRLYFTTDMKDLVSNFSFDNAFPKKALIYGHTHKRVIDEGVPKFYSVKVKGGYSEFR